MTVAYPDRGLGCSADSHIRPRYFPQCHSDLKPIKFGVASSSKKSLPLCMCQAAQQSKQHIDLE